MKTTLIIFALCGFLSGTALQAQTTTDASGEVVLIRDSLMKFLVRHSFQHYNVTPNIPKEFMEKKERYEIPADESVLAFIDASIMGNGKFGIAIGLKGLYIFNSKTSGAPGRKSLPYSTFKVSDIVRDNKDELSIGPVKIDILGLSKEDQNKAEAFFRDMKARLLR